MVEAAIVEKIRQYLISLPAYGVHSRRGILFGSFVTGGAHQWSDIDLVVVAPEFDGPHDNSLVKALWRATVVDDRIEPIPCGEMEWAGGNGRPILAIARREGVVIEV